MISGSSSCSGLRPEPRAHTKEAHGDKWAGKPCLAGRGASQEGTSVLRCDLNGASYPDTTQSGYETNQWRRYYAQSTGSWLASLFCYGDCAVIFDPSSSLACYFHSASDR